MGFKIIALVSFLAFYGCYFWKVFSQKRQGIRTNQIGMGKVGFVKFVELTMQLAAYLVFAGGLVSIFLGTHCPFLPLRVTGALLSAAGVGVFIVAVYTMRDSWRAGVSPTDKTELVTSGIYQFSRNPAFLGFDLLYLGTLCMFFNWPLFFLTALALTMYHLQIVNVEEDFLIAAFGEEYLQYRKKVCRYLGRK